jgi:hypothetical protein
VLLRFTLVTDGSSDQTLLPILDWLCKEHFQWATEGQWFDPRPFAPPSLSLQRRINLSLNLFPCDILFIHRDAEGTSHQSRCSEICEAVQSLSEHDRQTPYICVVPVRMTEAWLLFDEKAIRRAASNPNGKMNLDLPPFNEVERVQNPKQVLFQAIKVASGLNARRQGKINLSVCRHRIAEVVSDFSPLRNLRAFKMLEKDLLHIKNRIGGR